MCLKILDEDIAKDKDYAGVFRTCNCKTGKVYYDVVIDLGLRIES